MSRQYPTNFVEKILSWDPSDFERRDRQPEKQLQELVEAERIPRNRDYQESSSSLSRRVSHAPRFGDSTDSDEDYGYGASAAGGGGAAKSTDTKQYYDQFLPLVAGESYGHLVEGYNSTDRARTFRIKFEEQRDYWDEPFSSISCQGVFPRDYADSRIANVLYLPDFHPSGPCLGFASYKPRSGECVDLKIKIPKITDATIEYSSGARLEVKFLHSLVTKQRIFEACKRATQLPYMKQLVTGTVQFTRLEDAEAELGGGAAAAAAAEPRLPTFRLGAKTVLGDMRWNADTTGLRLPASPAQQSAIILEVLKKTGSKRDKYLFSGTHTDNLLGLATQWVNAGKAADMALVGFGDSLPDSLVAYSPDFTVLQPLVRQACDNLDAYFNSQLDKHRNLFRSVESILAKCEEEPIKSIMRAFKWNGKFIVGLCYVPQSSSAYGYIPSGNLQDTIRSLKQFVHAQKQSSRSYMSYEDMLTKVSEFIKNSKNAIVELAEIGEEKYKLASDYTKQPIMDEVEKIKALLAGVNKLEEWLGELIELDFETECKKLTVVHVDSVQPDLSTIGRFCGVFKLASESSASASSWPAFNRRFFRIQRAINALDSEQSRDSRSRYIGSHYGSSSQVGFVENCQKISATLTSLVTALSLVKEGDLSLSLSGSMVMCPLDHVLGLKGVVPGKLILLNEENPDEMELAGLSENYEITHSFQVDAGAVGSAHSIRLNPPQIAAIKRVLMTDDRVMMLQGPPGTGKTTSTVALLEELIFLGKSMVCASSNKAVQVLLDRFFKMHPEWPVIIVGVDKKIPEHLLPVSLHSFGSIIRASLNDLERPFVRATRVQLPAKMEKSVKSYLDGHKTFSLDKFIDLALGKDVSVFGNSLLYLDKSEEEEIRSDDTAVRAYLKAHPEINEAALAAQQEIPGKVKALVPGVIDFMRDLNKKYENYELEGLVRMKNKAKSIGLQIESMLSSPANSLEDALELVSQIKAYCTLCKTSLGDDRDLQKKLLESAKIVFCTLSVAGRGNFSEDLGRLNYLIIDEAGQATEALTLVPLQHRPDRLLLVGDTKQLPATVISEAARSKHYDWSLMQRLYEENDQPADMLTIQYRMHDRICRWPSVQFYDGRLVTAPVVRAARESFAAPCQLLEQPRAFFDLPSKQEKPGTSYRNKLEAAYILKIVEHIRAVDKVHTIGIISFYSAQVQLLARLLHKYLDKKTRVSTVDGFQGDECNYIILSCVRSQFSIGFLKDFRRLNVSITRPMNNLLVIGNLQFFLQKASDLQVMLQDMVDSREVVEQSGLDHLLKIDSSDEMAGLVASMARLAVSKSRQRPGRAQVRSSARGNASSGRKGTCHQWDRSGSCRYGRKCRFLHQANGGGGGGGGGGGAKRGSGRHRYATGNGRRW